MKITINSETLNYGIVSNNIKVVSDNIILNYGIVSNSIKVVSDNNILNYDLRMYDERSLIYKILLDFIETLSIGDVF